MTVVDMTQWREGRPSDEGEVGLVCPCGSAWFELVNGGAVTLNADRSVIGYAGELACIECGQHS